jgi:hypothetical protein
MVGWRWFDTLQTIPALLGERAGVRAGVATKSTWRRKMEVRRELLTLFEFMSF